MKIKIGNKIIKMFLSIVIFLISIRYIGKVYQPTLLDDEFVYIGIAKYFCGKDWSSMISNCSYYSYGYSLVLIPFVWFIKDTVLLYRVIVSLNGIFLVLSFILLINIFCNLFYKQIQRKIISENEVIFISFIVVLLPCFMNYALVALPECYLLFLFCLSVKILMMLNKKRGYFSFVGYGFVCIYLYIVHQRMAGIVVAGLIVLTYMLYKKEINKRQFTVTFFTALTMLFLHIQMKNYLKADLWNNTKMSNVNDTERVLFVLRRILTSKELFFKFILGIWGKIYYFASATFLFEIFGIVLLIIFLAKKSNSNNSIYNIYLYIGLSFLYTLGISAVFLADYQKLAYLIYGRYLETFMPILTGFGILQVQTDLNYKKKKRLCFVIPFSVIFYIASGIAVKIAIDRYNLTWLNYISNTSLYRFAKDDRVSVLNIMGIIIIASFLFLGILKLRNHFSGYYQIIIILIVIRISYKTSEIPFKAVNLPLQRERYETNRIVNDIKNLAKQDEQSLYYLMDQEELYTSQYRLYLQYWINDIKIYCITVDELKEKIQKNKESIVLITTNPLFFIEDRIENLNMNKYIVYVQNSYCKVWIKSPN